MACDIGGFRRARGISLGRNDVCTAFLGPCSLLPVYTGEIQCRMLGAAIDSYDERGSSCGHDVGELVVTEPMPSMPLGLYGDDGTRLHETYFGTYPGVWHHGDWLRLTRHGGAVIVGRSDATLNRGGVRMGTAEFYRIVESIAGVDDSLIVDTSELGVTGKLVLFIATGVSRKADDIDEPNARLTSLVRQQIREQLSPRHVPDEVIAVDHLPHTINGKRLEVPLRRILLGTPPGDAVVRSAVDQPELFDAMISSLERRSLLRDQTRQGQAAPKSATDGPRNTQ